MISKLFFITICSLASSSVFAQAGVPLLNISENPAGGTEYSLTLQVLILMTVLTLLPSLLIMMTSFVRIIIVMSLLRQAIGTAQTPPNIVLIGIALFLTFFIMSPILQTVYNDAAVPYIEEEISAEEALDVALLPLRTFMLTQTREDDLMIFSDIGEYEYDGVEENIPLSILIPSFMTSELKTAFTIGFLIYIPFVIIDLIVASVLMSMGMMMLSPMLVALPFKLLLFVLVDGWSMTVGSLVSTFAAG